LFKFLTNYFLLLLAKTGILAILGALKSGIGFIIGSVLGALGFKKAAASVRKFFKRKKGPKVKTNVRKKNGKIASVFKKVIGSKALRIGALVANPRIGAAFITGATGIEGYNEIEKGQSAKGNMSSIAKTVGGATLTGALVGGPYAVPTALIFGLTALGLSLKKAYSQSPNEAILMEKNEASSDNIIANRTKFGSSNLVAESMKIGGQSITTFANNNNNSGNSNIVNNTTVLATNVRNFEPSYYNSYGNLRYV